MAARSKIARAAAFGALALAVLAPVSCWAVPLPGQDPTLGEKTTYEGSKGTNFGLPFEPDAKIENGDDSIKGVNAIIKRGLQVVAGLSVLALIWAGITYVTSYGDEEKTKKAKKIILWTAAGLATGLGGWAVIDLVNSVTLQGAAPATSTSTAK